MHSCNGLCVWSGFNSQPPEGGWVIRDIKGDEVQTFQLTAARRRLVVLHQVSVSMITSFNSQPPEGGWVFGFSTQRAYQLFQLTAARRRLGQIVGIVDNSAVVSTHSRPKAAGKNAKSGGKLVGVSTHSRPKAAG